MEEIITTNTLSFFSFSSGSKSISLSSLILHKEVIPILYLSLFFMSAFLLDTALSHTLIFLIHDCRVSSQSSLLTEVKTNGFLLKVAQALPSLFIGLNKSQGYTLSS